MQLTFIMYKHNKYFFPRNFSFDDTHCEGARVIAQAAREAGVKRLIHVSALNASEESPSKLLQSKVLKVELIYFLFNLNLFELLYRHHLTCMCACTVIYACQNEPMKLGSKGSTLIF